MSMVNNYYEDVNRSPNNKSTAKMLYSFPRSERFATKNKVLCDKIYNLPSTNHKKAPGLGYGTKSDFTKAASTNPPPNSYIIRSIFDTNKQKKLGSAFGKGREDMLITGPLAITSVNQNPGPGAYPHKSTLSKSTYSFRGRHPMQDKEQRLVPGPGNYETPFPISKTGRYFLSKFRNVRSASFSAGHQKRFKQKIQNSPGPGNYRIALKPGGPEFVSKFKSAVARTFPHSERKPTNNSMPKVPGPGYYNLPTEFGKLETNKENDDFGAL